MVLILAGIVLIRQLVDCQLVDIDTDSLLPVMTLQQLLCVKDTVLSHLLCFILPARHDAISIMRIAIYVVYDTALYGL